MSNEDCATTDAEVITLDPPTNLVAEGGDGLINLTWDGVEPAASREDVMLWISDATTNQIEISMTNTQAVYGFQFNVVPDAQFQPSTYGYAAGVGSAVGAGFIVQTNNQGLVLGFSLTGSSIPPGTTPLITITWDAQDVDGFIDLDIVNFAGPGGIGLSYETGDPYCLGTCDETEITYNVYRDGSLYASGLEATEFLDDGLGFEETHCYTVTAFDGENESDMSNEDCATTNPEVITLEAPTNLVAEGGDGLINLTWDGVEPAASREDVMLWISDATTNQIEISMTNTQAVYGFQFNVVPDAQFQPSTYGYAAGVGSAVGAGFIVQTNNQGLVLGFSLTGSSIPPGTTPLITITWDAQDVDGFIDLDIVNFAGPGGIGLSYETGDPYCLGTCDETEITYNVYRDGSLYASGLEATEFLDDGLGFEETHCYTVTAFDGENESDMSNEDCATTDAEVITLDPPTNLVAEGGDGLINLTWDAPAREDVSLWVSDADLNHVEISMSNSANVYGFQFSIMADPQFMATAFTDMAIGSASDNGFISSTNDDGLVLGFSLIGAFIPAGSNGPLVTLSWEIEDVDGFIDLNVVNFAGPGGMALSVETGEPYCLGTCDETEITYNVYRDGDLYASGLEATEFLDDGLGYEESHCYTVTAFDGENESDMSNEDCATTDPEQVMLEAPTNLVAEGGDGLINVTWDPVSPPVMREDVYLWVSDADLDHVEISMSNSANVYGFQFFVQADEALMATAFSDMSSGLASDYGFLLSTNNEGLVLGFSLTGAFIPAGSNGPLVTLSWDVQDADGLIDLSIVNFAGPGGTALSTETGEPFCLGTCDETEITYNVYRDGSLFASGLEATEFLDDGLGFEETHCYTVTAFDGENESDMSNEDCATTDPEQVMLEAPTNLVAEGGDGVIDLSWDPVQPGPSREQVTLWVSNADANHVEISMSNVDDVYGFQFYVEADEALMATDFADMEIGYAADYDFLLSTNDDGLVLGFSLTGAFIPAGSNGPLVTLSWDITSDQGCVDLNVTNFAGANGAALSTETGDAYCFGEQPGEITYNVYRDGILLQSGVEMTVFSDTGLGFDETHCYTVTAFDGENESDMSNEDCATTNPEVITLEAPTNLVAEGGEGSISLTWDAPAREDVYVWISDADLDHIVISMSNTVNVYGFQLYIEADPALMATNYADMVSGLAADYGFLVSTNDFGLALGFSLTGAFIPAGSEGPLVTFSWDIQDVDGFVDLNITNFAGPAGLALSYETGEPFCLGDCGETEITYNIYRDEILYATGVTDNFFTDGGLGYSESHCYAVTATDGIDESDFSNVACAETDPLYGCTDPEALNYDPMATVDDGSCEYAVEEPTNLVATGGDHEITLTWDGPGREDVLLYVSNADTNQVEIFMVNTVDVYGFQFYIEADPALMAAGFTDLAMGLAADAGFMVSTNESGLVLGFSLTNQYIPANANDVLVTLSWNITNAPGCVDLNIINFAGEGGVPISTLTGDPFCIGLEPEEVTFNVYRDGMLHAAGIETEVYVDSGLDASEFHCYHVTAVVDEGESGFSNEACATTDPEPMEHFVIGIDDTGVSSLVIIDGVIGVDPGDEIGLFDAMGIQNSGDCSNQLGELLVGSGTWMGEQLNLSAIGSLDYCDIGGYQFAGYVEGNPIVFKVWKAADQMEYVAQATFSQGDGTWGQLITVVSLEVVTTVTQYINIQAFQNNMFSLNVIPEMPLMDDIFGEQFLLVSNDSGEFYVPSYGVDQIISADIADGYRGFLAGPNAIVLEIVGTPVGIQDCLTLHQFMINLIPYYPSEPLPASEVFGPYDDSILIAGNDSGQFYVPSMGVNTMPMMYPGEAYAVFLMGNQPLEFCWPEPGLAMTANPSVISEYNEASVSQQYAPVQTGSAHAIIITEMFVGVASGDELVAYADGEVVGATRILDPAAHVVLAAWEGFSSYGVELPGYAVGDEIELRLYSSLENRELRVTADLDNWHYGEAPLTSGSITISEFDAVPQGFQLGQNYPNPFNPATTIDFSVDQQAFVNLAVYDLAGRLVKILVDHQVSQGYYSVVWDATDAMNNPVSAGMYIYTLQSGDTRISHKMVLMK